jgi:hypothetical protein
MTNDRFPPIKNLARVVGGVSVELLNMAAMLSRNTGNTEGAPEWIRVAPGGAGFWTCAAAAEDSPQYIRADLVRKALETQAVDISKPVISNVKVKPLKWYFNEMGDGIIGVSSKGEEYRIIQGGWRFDLVSILSLPDTKFLGTFNTMDAAMARAQELQKAEILSSIELQDVNNSLAEHIQALSELVDLVAQDILGPSVEDEPDNESVGMTIAGPLPMTFGHVRRAQKAIAVLKAEKELFHD